MSIPQDIQQRVRTDAGADADEMLARLSSFAIEHPDMSDRILRCLAFLARGKLGRLGHAIRLAETDWRDAIVAAEYEPRSGTKRWQGDRVQVRDFNKPFE